MPATPQCASVEQGGCPAPPQVAPGFGSLGEVSVPAEPSGGFTVLAPTVDEPNTATVVPVLASLTLTSAVATVPAVPVFGAGGVTSGVLGCAMPQTAAPLGVVTQPPFGMESRQIF